MSHDKSLQEGRQELKPIAAWKGGTQFKNLWYTLKRGLFYNVCVFGTAPTHRPTVCWKLTAEGPSWKPWTVIRTVSPTLALLGLMDSLGPLGAAGRKVKYHVGLLHSETTHSSQMCE